MWQIGKNDLTVEDLKLETHHDLSREELFDCCVRLEPYGDVSGTFELVEDPLDVGKSADVAYSYGFFIIVRKRLLNMQENLFGVTSLPHGVGFNRFRAVVHADFLDNFLTADREDAGIDAKKARAGYLAVIDETHPFYRSFADYPGARRLAIAEILLEGYILAAGVDMEGPTIASTRKRVPGGCDRSVAARKAISRLTRQV